MNQPTRPSPPWKQYNVRLTKDQIERLHRQAEILSVSVAAVIRLAIESFLEEHR